jgi:hypothetical protein
VFCNAAKKSYFTPSYRAYVTINYSFACVAHVQRDNMASEFTHAGVRERALAGTWVMDNVRLTV